MITDKYKDEGIDIADPEEKPFHNSLSDLPAIMNGMIKRTREAPDHGDSYMPLTAVFVDDLAAGSGPSEGYRLMTLFSNCSQLRVIAEVFASSCHSRTSSLTEEFACKQVTSHCSLFRNLKNGKSLMKLPGDRVCQESSSKLHSRQLNSAHMEFVDFI